MVAVSSIRHGYVGVTGRTDQPSVTWFEHVDEEGARLERTLDARTLRLGVVRPVGCRGDHA